MRMMRMKFTLTSATAAAALSVSTLFVAATASAHESEGAQGAHAQSPARASGEVEKLIARLGSSDAASRAGAACALGRMEAKAAPAIPRLVALLADGAPVDKTCGNEPPFEDEQWEPDYETVKETTVGEAATHALMAVGDEGHQALAVALTEAADWRARKNAAWALAHRGDAPAMRRMVAALRDAAWQVRVEAAYALFQRGGDGAEIVAALAVAASGDEDWRVRKQAAFALGHKGGAAGVPESLLRVLREDADARVRAEAAGGLWHSAGSREFPALMAALKDEDKGVRGRVAETLGNRAGNDDVPVLIAALKDRDERVRDGARRALRIVKQRSEGQVTNLRPLPPGVPE